MPKNEHALLSASASSRWLNCTAAPHFEEQFPDKSSEYAEEGTLAHELCELETLKVFTKSLTARKYNASKKKLKENPLFSAEMERSAAKYIEVLQYQALEYSAFPFITPEIQVDLTAYIPEGFGRCDCVMIGDDRLTIVDFKYGKGVPVSAEGNSQMRLYALGALDRYSAIYGDVIKNVRTLIVQPRISETPSVETLTVDELRAWGESIKPIAKEAFDGPGVFNPGEHCRFCKGKAVCKARAEKNTALEEFKNCVPDPMFGQGKLNDEEIGDLLVRGKDLVAWYKDLEDYALNATLNGYTIPGWKAVEGRSNRAFSDLDAALDAAISAGYDESLVYDRKPKSLSELEKLMGKTAFSETLGKYVIKPRGKPTLVPITDKRPEFNSAALDFAEASEINKQL